MAWISNIFPKQTENGKLFSQLLNLKWKIILSSVAQFRKPSTIEVRSYISFQRIFRWRSKRINGTSRFKVFPSILSWDSSKFCPLLVFYMYFFALFFYILFPNLTCQSSGRHIEKICMLLLRFFLCLNGVGEIWFLVCKKIGIGYKKYVLCLLVPQRKWFLQHFGLFFIKNNGDLMLKLAKRISCNLPFPFYVLTHCRTHTMAIFHIFLVSSLRIPFLSDCLYGYLFLFLLIFPCAHHS